MVNYYGYISREDGSEPTGSEGRILFTLKTKSGAIKRCQRVLGKRFKLYTYTNLYNNNTHILIWKE